MTGEEKQMGVYAYSTGSVFKTTATPVEVQVTVNNRTTLTQLYRVIVWDTSAGVKSPISNSTQLTVAGNNTAQFSVLVSNPMLTAATRIEVEIRLSDEHMAPFAELVFTPGVAGGAVRTDTVYPNQFLVNEDSAGTP